MSRHRIALVLVLAGACRSDERVTAPAGANGYGAPAVASADVLRASLEVDAAPVPAGGPFRVRFIIENTSSGAVTAQLACTGMVLMGVRAANGAEVGTSSRLPNGCLTAVTPLPFAAGQRRVLDVTGLAVESAYPAEGTRPLAAGRYAVVASPTVMEVDGRRVTLPRLERPLVVQ